VDLLGLTDADLFQTIQLWVGNGTVYTVSEEVHMALGYTPNPDGQHAVSSTTGQAGDPLWLAPTPQQLRAFLADMAMPFFAQHILPLAFESLHTLHPDWGEGATFNAHLANSLRGNNQTRNDISTSYRLLQ